MKKNYTIIFLTILAFSLNVNSQNYREIVKTYLDSNKEELNLFEVDVKEWNITSEVYSKKSNVTHIYIQQLYNGIPINGAVANFSIKNNEIKYAKNSFISNLPSKTNSSNPILTSKRAIEKGASQLNLGNTGTITLIENIGLNKFMYSKSGISQEKIPVSLVYQPIEDGTLKLSWDLNILQLDGMHWWSLRVDATSGEIIHKNDWIVNCEFPEKDIKQSEIHSEVGYSEFVTQREQPLLLAGEQYNVFAIPAESPNHGPRSVLTEPHNINASPFGWHDTDGVDGAEFTITRGNNVYAQEDANANNGFGYSPDGTSTLNFNFALDLNQQPATYLDASLTNLFYMNNIMHDIWFQYGFDAEAGSFQTNNYGAGGSAGDPVIADGQDGFARNNANFGTPPDGSSPRMQMFLFDPPGPQLINLLTINSPGDLAGEYDGIDSNYGGPPLSSTTPITSDIVLVNNIGLPVNGACSAITNSAQINGKIAIIQRGECDFVEKVQRAENAGAIAVIIVTDDRDVIAMGGTSTTITIPAIMISNADGNAIIDSINNGNTINVTLFNPVGVTPDIDGSLDNGVIAHEYGHGISNRLIGGRNNTSCMQNAEQQGEGWSDFFGLMITIEPGDTETDGRGIGTYDLGQSTNGNGFRQFPYSTDMTINPFTFDDLKDQEFTNAIGNLQVSVHGVGSIWATMMWDLNWRMIDVYGLDLDIYNGTGGNNMTMSLAIEGLKMAPCSASFIEMRDAIIAADDLLNNGDNLCLIWQVFSRRGLGFSASSGSTNSYSDQIEAFDMPPEAQLGGASCSLGVNDEKSELFKIYPNPSNGQININGTGINEEVAITIFDINGREVYTKKTTLNGSTNINATNLNTGFYILKIKGKEFIYNKKILIE